jgi:hypothetical protein
MKTVNDEILETRVRISKLVNEAHRLELDNDFLKASDILREVENEKKHLKLVEQYRGI